MAILQRAPGPYSRDVSGHISPDPGLSGALQDTGGPDVISEIFPGATVKIKPKRELPHERQMVLSLEDGRDLIINFDQGFGAWQVVGKPRHRFDGRPSEQAASLLNLSESVTIREGQNGTVIVRSAASVL
jgi:hypothetical protein